MPIYLLGTHTRSVAIPNDPLSVTLLGPAGRAELRVTAGSSQRLVRIGAQTVAIPSLAEPATIGVEPIGAPAFGHDTVVQLVIGGDVGAMTDGLDPVQVIFDPVNVSGCHTADLATLTPHDGRIKVAALASGATALSPLASMARTAARRGAAGRRETATRLSVGIDGSASMFPAFHDGSVAAAVDLIIGVADAIGIAEVTAVVVGADCTSVDAPAAHLAEAVAGTPRRWSAGARWSCLPSGGRTLLITDAPSELTRRGCPVLWTSADTRLAERGPLLLPPPVDVPARQHLADHPAIVDHLVTGLLAELL